jgi:hypothetical protein
MAEEAAGTGLGVRWEGKLIDNRIYTDTPSGSRYIPILPDGGSPVHRTIREPGHDFRRDMRWGC